MTDTKPNKPTDSTLFKQQTGCELFVRDDDWYVFGANSAEKAQEDTEFFSSPISASKIPMSPDNF